MSSDEQPDRAENVSRPDKKTGLRASSQEGASDSGSPSKRFRPPEDTGNAGLAVMIPGILAASVVVGCLLGSAFDRWRGSSPWGLLVGLLLGMATGVREMMRLLRRMNKDQ